MVYTVKQIANLAGISARTLHFYDEIGLLKPTSYGENGYRYYGEDALLRLQQILFYRELEFSLNDIRAILDKPGFDVVRSLQAHKKALERKAKRLDGLIATVDKTLLHLKGKIEMENEELFTGFDEEKQKRYEQEAAKRWGEKEVKQSTQRWNSYTAKQKQQIFAEAGAIYSDLLQHVGGDPTTDAVQAIVARWHQNIRYFYEPTTEILMGLAQGYAEDPEFRAFYTKMHPDMPDFLRAAIEHYCIEVLATT
jgi:MerR family transcriptional regulator, thiopeptide resistance regulator